MYSRWTDRCSAPTGALCLLHFTGARRTWRLWRETGRVCRGIVSGGPGICTGSLGRLWPKALRSREGLQAAAFRAREGRALRLLRPCPQRNGLVGLNPSGSGSSGGFSGCDGARTLSRECRSGSLRLRVRSLVERMMTLEMLEDELSRPEPEDCAL